VTLPNSAAEANGLGLDRFAEGDPVEAARLLSHAYRLLADEPGVLVNLGLALMQQGRIEPAERCYRMALRSRELRVRRSAAKNLGFLHLWLGQFEEGWSWHGRRFAGEAFETTQWKGEPLNGRVLTIWNDVGMGDAFQFVRYTKPLIQRGERVRWAVHASQLAIFQKHLAWPLTDVVDRSRIDRNSCLHIPLMSLIPILDLTTNWGRTFAEPTWQLGCCDPENKTTNAVGLCWASNPGDRTMHRYKSTNPERLKQRVEHLGSQPKLISLQSDEVEAHQKLGLVAADTSWVETLERIFECKHVVSVDTAVAHLAGGAGRTVDLMLGYPADWRWQQFTTQTSLWYPNLKCWPINPH